MRTCVICLAQSILKVLKSVLAFMVDSFALIDNIFCKNLLNLLRAKANGRMVYSVPLIIFLDDVSGNISKQWNKHHVVYMSNALLPREMLDKQFCVQFCSASPHASPIEFMHAVRDNIVYVMCYHFLNRIWSYSKGKPGKMVLWHLTVRKRRRFYSYPMVYSLQVITPCNPFNAAIPGLALICSVGFAKRAVQKNTRQPIMATLNFLR